jgi:hypothetical protein
MIQITVDSGAGADTLLDSNGIDLMLGGDGDDVEINSLGADTVSSVTAASEDWLSSHARIRDGKTVLDVGGKQRTLRAPTCRSSSRSLPRRSPAAPEPLQAIVRCRKRAGKSHGSPGELLVRPAHGGR